MTTILLVENDPLQAFLMMSLLNRHFSYVRRAADAAEALCLIEQSDIAEKLGLVISGHHPLGIGGPAFVAELRARLPHVPVLVLGSGDEQAADYADDQVVFLPRRLFAERMIPLTEQLLRRDKSEVA